MNKSEHNEIVRAEFTRQAALFAAAPEMNDEEALQKLVELAKAGPADIMLDVASGPGIVVCAFAQCVAHATGIDLTPSMVEHARRLQEQKGLSNVSWHVGDVRSLPFADGDFSIVTSRYSFHHIERPQEVLAEMVRVCREGGRIVLVDVVASGTASKADAFNRMERLRDPSHVRAMSLAELHQLFEVAGLLVSGTILYRIEFDVDYLLQGSFPADDDSERLRRLFVDSMGNDSMGLATHEEAGRLVCSYPVAMLLAER